MTWFRVDDKLHDHPKLRKLRSAKLAALGLWTACGSWAGDNLTDGFVPSEIVQRFDPDEGLAKRLVEVGLWAPAEQDDEIGYRFHQWVEHQPTKADVQRRRDEARERMRRRRAGGSTEPQTDTASSSQGVRANNERTSPDVPHPDPTRPVPSRGSSSEEPPASPRSRKKPATAMPELWRPNDRHTAFAAEHGLDLRFQANQFRGHAQANDRRLADWDAGFRNWLGIAVERQSKTGRAPLRLASGGHVPYRNPDPSEYAAPDPWGTPT